MLTADKRGWGHPGTPGSAESRAYAKAHIGKAKAAGLTLSVRTGAPTVIFTAFLNDLRRRGYPLVGKVADDWGYAPRYIRGTGPGTGRPGVLSNHAWGLAVDLNATTNPMTSDGRNHTDMPGWVRGLAEMYGLRWGGSYTGARHDPMHFELMLTLAEANRLAKKITANGGTLDTPAHPKPTKPTSKPARPSRRPALHNPYPEPTRDLFVQNPKDPRTWQRGADVRWGQWALGMPERMIDGVAGKDFDRWLRDWQRVHARQVGRADGVLGARCRAVLRKVTR